MRLFFGILMVLVYVGMGAMLAFSNLFGLGTTGIVIGALMVIYGVFRGIRLYRSL